MRRPVRRAWGALGLVTAAAGLAVGGTLLSVDTGLLHAPWLAALVSAPFVLAAVVLLYLAGFTTAGVWSRGFVLLGLFGVAALTATALYLHAENRRGVVADCRITAAGQHYEDIESESGAAASITVHDYRLACPSGGPRTMSTTDDVGGVGAMVAVRSDSAGILAPTPEKPSWSATPWWVAAVGCAVVVLLAYPVSPTWQSAVDRKLAREPRQTYRPYHRTQRGNRPPSWFD